jgi:hypothetical protein
MEELIAEECGKYDRVILSFNWSFGRELVVLHTKLSIFYKFLEHAK